MSNDINKITISTLNDNMADAMVEVLETSPLVGEVTGEGNTSTETDPIFQNSVAFTIDDFDIQKWNAAYTWGNHSTQGYLTSADVDAANKLDNTFAVFKDVEDDIPPDPQINNDLTVPQTVVYTKSRLEGSVRITQHLAKDHTGAEIVFYETKEIL